MNNNHLLGFLQGYVLFPLAIHAMDLIVSGIGIMMTEAPKGKGSKMLGRHGATRKGNHPIEWS